MQLIYLYITLLGALLSGLGDSSRVAAPVLIDDFESYEVEGLPIHWRYIDAGQKFLPVTPSIMSKDEYFVVLKDGANKFVRAYTKGRAHRLVMPNGQRYRWNLKEHPVLAWEWRAQHLPAGAREDVKRLNDTGGAVYVTFDRDWVGRPRSIKYTYSSTLPVGATVSYGNRLAVVVASSGKEGAKGWRRIERNIVEDYRKFFGGEPNAEPVSIMIWSDSDSTGDHAEVDFDNVRLLAARR